MTFKQTLGTLAALIGLATSAHAGAGSTARVQVIHNCADAAASDGPAVA